MPSTSAQVTRAPLLACHVRFGRAWRLQTWDRFVIPWPFSRLTVVLDELLEVPRSLDGEAFEEMRVQFEERMRDGVRRIQEIVEIVGNENDEIKTQTLFEFTYQGEGHDGLLVGGFEARKGAVPGFMEKARYFGLENKLATIMGAS